MTTRREIAVAVEDLRKTYGNAVAVAGVSLEVRKGEIFGLLGPNGSGKTTTVECIQGLRTPDSGSIRVLGLDPQTQPREVRRRIGSQLQESALPDRIKVWEALRLAATLTPVASDWEALIRDWGLTDKRRARFSDLSGGQRQRLFVALALVNHPEVVFLDEMTTGLDPSARRVAWELIGEIRAQGATVVLVSHFMDEAEYLCDRAAVLVDGRIVACDTPQALIHQHGGEVRITFRLSPARSLPELDHEVRVDRRGDVTELFGPPGSVARIAHRLVEHGIDPPDFRIVQPTLEAAYLRLTGGRTD